MAWSDTARLVDVSHWNPEDPNSADKRPHRLMDWGAAVQSGTLAGAIIKYTQGCDGTDPAAFLHAYNAYTAGVPLLAGYHFGDASDPSKQAAHFLDLMHQDWGADLARVMLMLDAEQQNPAGQMSVRQAELFVTAVKLGIGRWPWLYMGRDGPDGTGKGLPSAILSNCTLVIPAYGDHAANLGTILPKGWRLPADAADGRNGAGLGVVRAWQFTDGRVNGGPFPGLGIVDQSRLIGVASADEAKAVWTR